MFFIIQMCPDVAVSTVCGSHLPICDVGGSHLSEFAAHTNQVSVF